MHADALSMAASDPLDALYTPKIDPNPGPRPREEGQSSADFQAADEPCGIADAWAFAFNLPAWRARMSTVTARRLPTRTFTPVGLARAE